MAAHDVNSRGNVGPVLDRNAKRICDLSGMDLSRQRLVEYQQLRAALEMSIQDLDRECRREGIVNAAFTVAKFTKASCDAFIGMASSFVEVLIPGAKDSAKLVEKSYGVAAPLAGAISAGGDVDKVSTASAIFKNAVALGTSETGYVILAEGAGAKAEVINAALKGDTKGAVTTAVSYIYDLHVTIAGAIGSAKADRVAAVASIAKQAFEYNEAVSKCLDELVSLNEESSDRFISTRASLRVQAGRIAKKISEIEALLSSCEAVPSHNAN